MKIPNSLVINIKHKKKRIMGNLLITAKCNRQCTFCFAGKRLKEIRRDKQVSTNISRENVRVWMDFLERSSEMNLRLLGGEPTLHPEFINIVEEALGRNFHIQLFSNCIISKQKTDYLSEIPKEKLSILANISPQANDSEKQIALRTYALEKLGDRICQGITITSTEFDYQFLIENIKIFNLVKKIRVGVAQPIVGHNNEYFHPSDYPKLGKCIVDMAAACFDKDILIGFDCGMTLCMFTENELGKLMKTSSGYTSVCRPIIDVSSNLDIWACFPLSEVLMTRLEKYNNRKEIEEAYEKRLAPYRSIGCMPDCLTCVYKRRQICNGGCIAHAMNSLNRMPPRHIDD
jgi:radical SAM protein with 4Fe4S-binding SPASM domain